MKPLRLSRYRPPWRLLGAIELLDSARLHIYTRFTQAGNDCALTRRLTLTAISAMGDDQVDLSTLDPIAHHQLTIVGNKVCHLQCRPDIATDGGNTHYTGGDTSPFDLIDTMYLGQV